MDLIQEAIQKKNLADYSFEDLLKIYSLAFSTHNKGCVDFKELVSTNHILSDNEIDLLTAFRNLPENKQSILLKKLRTE